MPEKKDSTSSPLWLIDPKANLDGSRNTFYKNYKFTGPNAATKASELITDPEFLKYWTKTEKPTAVVSMEPSGEWTNRNWDSTKTNYGKPFWDRPTPLPKRPPHIRGAEIHESGQLYVDEHTGTYIPDEMSSIPFSDEELAYWKEYERIEKANTKGFRINANVDGKNYYAKPAAFTNDKVEYLDIGGNHPLEDRVRLAKLQQHQRLNPNERIGSLVVNEGVAYPETTANYIGSRNFRGYATNSNTPLMLSTPSQQNVNLDVELYTGNELNRAARRYDGMNELMTKRTQLPPIPNNMDIPDGVDPRPILANTRTDPTRRIGSVRPWTKTFPDKFAGTTAQSSPDAPHLVERMGGNEFTIKGPPIVSNLYTGTGWGKMPNMTNVGRLFGAVTGGLGTAYQLYDQVNAVTGRNGDTTLDREYGGSDPLSLRAGMDVGLDVLTGDFGPQTIRNYEQRVNDPEYIARNPLSSMVGQGMRGNTDYLKAFYNAQLFVPKFAQFNENKTIYNAPNSNLERVGLYKRDYAGQGFVGK
jgi:hypothetical protein